MPSVECFKKRQGNVANTYQGSSLCYVLSIVSGKNRHINEMVKKTSIVSGNKRLDRDM